MTRAVLIRASWIRAVSISAGQVAAALMDLGRWYLGEFAGRRTETGAAPFPAAGT